MATTETTEIVVVCDAGPLIHLDELGCLGLLSDFREVLDQRPFGVKLKPTEQPH